MMIIPNNSALPGHSSQMINNFAINSNIPPQNAAMTAKNSPWIITPLEHQSNEGQFVILHPIGVPPMIGGDQARPFFLKSGLPATILAQIWQLADLNKDGKLDRFEFSVAMKLVRNCLTGIPLPPTLPDSMRQIIGLTPSMSMGQFNGGAPTLSGPIPQPQMPPRPMSTYGTMPAMNSSYRPSYGGSYSAAQTPTHSGGGSLPFQMGTKELGDWTLPQPVKLRFCQQFNQLDRSRVGLLTGQQARGVLGESQLPTQLLAQIWNMSDVNKDGCLSIEEFCTAQFLIEMIKAGYALPLKLPNELHAFCNRSKTVSPSTVPSTPTDPNVPPPQKSGTGHFKTFEDKRRDNLDKGQAELDRRRQILQEEEERRRAEIERREREEAEKKERERQELEKRREAEIEVERQKELERERERAAEEEKMKAHREEARRRLEMERIKELEKIRIRDLENQLQAETEKTTQIQQRQKTMAFQLQALDERSQQLNTEITGERDKILKITQEIEGMREKRDEKCAKIQEAEKKARELNVQSERFGHENLQLQSECQRQLSRVNEIDSLKNEMIEIDGEIKQFEKETQKMGEKAANQEKLVIGKRPDWEQSCSQFREIEKEHQEFVDRYDNKRRGFHPNAFMPARSSIPPQYEMPPDAMFGSTAERRTSKESLGNNNATGFDNNFTPNFTSQKSIDGDGRRKSETDSTGNVAAITAKLQQQLKFGQATQQKQQALLSREGSVTSTGKPSIQPSSSIEALQQQQLGANVKTVKYRALYEFNARSGDELSLQPGDVIMVFEGHQSEPGWLAGQIRDKVGWFPASFSEPIAASTSPTQATVGLKKAGSLTGSPSGEPLASIQEEGEVLSHEKQQQAVPSSTSFQADFASAFPKSVSFTDPYSASLSTSQPQTATISASHSTGAFTASALYDLPPIDKKKQIALDEPKSEPNAIPASSFAPPLYEIPPGDGIGGTSSPTDKDIIIQGTGIALYQWKARNDQEMSFSRGDTIEVLEQGEMRWRGRLQKNKQIHGWFPKSYIKMEVTAQGEMRNTQGQCERQHGNGSLLNGKNETMESKNSMTEQQKRRGSQTGDAAGEWFIALYQFDAVEPTDLSLRPGDRILVTDQKDQWWRGNCEGRSGIFPANYVQRATEMNATMASGIDKKITTGRAIAAFNATASNQISLGIGDFVRVHQMTPGGWWEGELEREGDKHTGWFPGNYIQVINGQDSDGKIMAIAAFDYQAQHDDELSFKAGDSIEVFDRSDTQWWKGRKQDDARQLQPLLFPANFVQLK